MLDIENEMSDSATKVSSLSRVEFGPLSVVCRQRYLVTGETKRKTAPNVSLNHWREFHETGRLAQRRELGLAKSVRADGLRVRITAL